MASNARLPSKVCLSFSAFSSDEVTEDKFFCSSERASSDLSKFAFNSAICPLLITKKAVNTPIKTISKTISKAMILLDNVESIFIA
ncbi:hypothetical protein [Shewanella xiamenensis]|uniref:hypothetical protein n=1 Tax=Shewanella xiamenensis TaxID=332186 RepID=UPI003B007462